MIDWAIATREMERGGEEDTTHLTGPDESQKCLDVSDGEQERSADSH